MFMGDSWGGLARTGGVLGLVLLAASCASTPKVNWDDRVGDYTYDQTVLEMGPPERSSELSDGTRVADWLTKRGSTLSFGVGTGYYGGRSGLSVGQSVSSGPSGQYLRLTFNPEGVLSAWEKLWR